MSDDGNAAWALDGADQHLIDLLMVDGRTSNRALARQVGLSEVTVAARVRSLQERRLLGVSVVLDWRTAGYSWDLSIYVEVIGRPPAQVADDLARLRYVHWVMLALGPADIVLHVHAPSQAAIVELLDDGLGRVPGVAHVEVQVNFETLKYDVRFARLPVQPTELEFPAPELELDELDRSVIGALMADGRRSNRELARELGVSDSTVGSRLARLTTGRLLRICGQTDPYRTGRVGAWAYVNVEVTGGLTSRTARQLSGMSEVLIVNICSGPTTVSAFVVAESRGALLDVVLAKVRAMPGVRKTIVTEVIRTVKLDYHWARLIDTE